MLLYVCTRCESRGEVYEYVYDDDVGDDDDDENNICLPYLNALQYYWMLINEYIITVFLKLCLQMRAPAEPTTRKKKNTEHQSWEKSPLFRSPEVRRRLHQSVSLYTKGRWKGQKK